MADNWQNRDTITDPKRREFIVSCFLGASSVILARLWYLQVIQKENFSIASDHNHIREIIHSAPRGIIYDRHKNVILDNNLFFDLIIVPQFLKDKDKLLTIISEMTHIPIHEIEEKLHNANTNAQFVPIRLKKNLSINEISVIESTNLFLPGIDIDSVPRRNYHGKEPAHLIGYLAEITEKDIDVLNAKTSNNDRYRAGSIIGKTGIEKKCEEYLRGVDGHEALSVDAFGRIQVDSSLAIPTYLKRPAQQGSSVYLTIDSDLQTAAIDAFKGKNGAICALIPDTGEILVYLSNPNPQLSLYQDNIKTEDWQKLRDDPFKPLLDKVTGGAYPPGSTFKIITAIAALEEGVVTPEKEFHCPGYYALGRNIWKCWKHTGHGNVNMLKGIEFSCDVYFYNVGSLLGIDRISKWGKIFGLGEKTGLDLNMELSGISPSTEWKFRVKGMPWSAGDTINASIGQGFNLCTPIQILNAFAAVGNGGMLLRPYIIKKIEDADKKIVLTGTQSQIRKIRLNYDNLMLVKQGLFNVVQSDTGTAKKARVPGFTVSGKTGTAQNSSLKFLKKMKPSNMEFQALDHAWFASYSPSEKPEIAVLVFSEYDGGGGGANAAPIAQKIIETYWRKKFPEKFENPDSDNDD